MEFHSIPSVDSENHSNIYIQEQILQHPLSPATEKIMKLNPRAILGMSHLFDYDSVNQNIRLSSSFQNLLRLLVQLEELDSKALKAKSLYELNTVLQQPQGAQGGLLRKEGIERWDLEDNSIKKQSRKTFDVLLKELGFEDPISLDSEMIVDHCIVFGALSMRMESRILQTVNYLANNLSVTGHVFLLGSNRLLIKAETEHLKSKMVDLEESQRVKWENVFKDPELSTEANAFAFLWECIVPLDMQTRLKDKLIAIKSTRIGHSYNDQQGYRVTTEVTAEDWMIYYGVDKSQAIFALAELPYIRLNDQLRFTVLSNGKKANLEELIERIMKTTFYFATSSPTASSQLSVILDEIGRNVYRTVDALKYLEKMEEEEPKS